MTVSDTNLTILSSWVTIGLPVLTFLIASAVANYRLKVAEKIIEGDIKPELQRLSNRIDGMGDRIDNLASRIDRLYDLQSGRMSESLAK